MLDPQTQTPQSRRRRVRASHTKHRMWAETQAWRNPWMFPHVGNAPWWQLEPEHPPGSSGAHSWVDASGESITLYQPDNITAAPSLCGWLYGEGIFASEGDFKANIDDENFSGTGTYVHKANLTSCPQDSFDNVPDEVRCKIAKCLFCIEDWGRWKSRGYTDEDATSVVEARFEDGYMGRSADGWAYIDEDLDDSDPDDFGMNSLGHMFTFGRDGFWKVCMNAPANLRDEISAFAGQHPAVQATSGFEELPSDHSPGACDWQEQYNDDNDKDELMVLIRLLRAVMPFIAT